MTERNITQEPISLRRLASRQAVLLALLEALGGRAPALDFQKLLFLFCQECDGAWPVYEFVPYKYGAFSFTSYADQRRLVEARLLERKEDVWMLTETGRTACNQIPKSLRAQVNKFIRRYAGIRGDALLGLVYRRFPYYAYRSELLDKVLKGDALGLQNIEMARPTRTAARLFTIGYEGRSVEGFFNALLQAGVTCVCDVRRNPISRKYGFSKGELSRICAALEFSYVHLPELGIPGEERRDMKSEEDLKRLFERYERTTLPACSTYLERIGQWVQEGAAVALLCFERESERCHRLRIAEALQRRFGNAFYATHL